ncbi:MAG: CRTAC1 family protein [Gemmataceae bacterium]|nr:CRTAC1 family protein [Gemmataceae bacterium]
MSRRRGCEGFIAWRLPAMLLTGLAAGGCHRPAPSDLVPPASGSVWFEDATQAVGLDFIHDAGAPGRYFLPQVIGSGAALFDCDGDDRLDIYLIQNGGPNSEARNQLYRQRADGTFENISAGSGLDVAGHGMGVAIGDVNNDGRPDLVLTEYRGLRLFLNQGGGKFIEATKDSGLDDVHWATSASFVDYDRDGWLDLVVAHYVDYDPARRCPGSGGKEDFCHPKTFAGAAARVYRNLGRRAGVLAAFRDMTAAAGLAHRPSNGLGVVCADLNGDRWPDLFLANDARPNHLWINQRDGTFREEALSRGCAVNALGQAEGNMGIACADLDGDGLLDLFVTHLTEETHTLWRQGPVGIFTDRTAAAGLATPTWRGTGFGVVAADFDADGHLDLALVNGRVARKLGASALGFHWTDYAERHQLFANDGTGRFRDLSPTNAPLCGTARVGRGLCAGDIFGTGRVDLLATHVADRARVYRNVVANPGHWLIVRAVTPEWRRDAYGAEVTVFAGTRRWTRLIQPGSSYLCSNDPRAHFGLGEVTAVDRLRVVWPDGAVEEFPGSPVDRRLVVRRGEGKVVD